MKRIFAILAAVFAALALSVSASAEIKKLPLLAADGDTDSRVLAGSIAINRNYRIDKGDTLVIPSGKRLRLTDGKTFTLNGKLFIENGGSLVIESGRLVMNEGAVLLSCGKVKIRQEGTVTVMPDASFIIAPDGALTLEGKIDTDLKFSRAACLGKYKSEAEGFGAEILAAVSWYRVDPYTGECRGFKTYNADEAKELFPKNFTASGYQYAPAGASEFTERFFLANGQTVDIIIYGGKDGKDAWLNGLFIKLE